MKKKAVLNENNILVGFEDVEELQQGDIDGGDGQLSTNNMFKWTGKCFQLLGTGYPKPKAHENGVTMEYAIYRMMEAFCEGKEPPLECRQWVIWFEKNLKKRQEEKLKRGRR
ncbi:MAG: hypothetical protein HOG49_19405 [Candidatus Scalindua sp.]|jgi:hypothetical protein|nr:hypothetical protein [Candidatus Scalindua sp.]